jgi:chromate transporter
MNLFLLAFLFFIVGLFTLGGGLVSIALIDQWIVQTGFISRLLFETMISIAESTPGPIAINLATYIGFNEASWLGAILVTFSFVLPSILATWFIALPLLRHAHRPVIQSILKYITWSVGAIIFYAVYTLIRSSTIFLNLDLFSLLFSVGVIGLTLVLAYRFPKHPLWLIALGGVIGFFYF